MSYFLLSCPEGSGYIEVLTKAKLLELLHGIEEDQPRCVEAIPETDMGYWGNVSVLIKGEIVMPKPVQTVTEWTID